MRKYSEIEYRLARRERPPTNADHDFAERPRKDIRSLRCATRRIEGFKFSDNDPCFRDPLSAESDGV